MRSWRTIDPPALLNVYGGRGDDTRAVRRNDHVSTPDLSLYCGGAAVGAAHTLQAKTMFWVDIGQATFSVISETDIALEASYRVLRRSGRIALNVTVTGQNAGQVQINGFTLACSFEPRPNVLLVHYKTADGKPQLLSFSTQKNGVLIDGDVVPVKVLVKT